MTHECFLDGRKIKMFYLLKKYDLTSSGAEELGSALPLLQHFPGKTLMQGAFWTLSFVSL